LQNASYLNIRAQYHLQNTMSSQRVTVSDEDFLTEDPALRGQKYVCLSFMNPTDVVKRKEAYVFERYLEAFSRDVGVLVKDLADRYPSDNGCFETLKEKYAGVFTPDLINEEYSSFIATHPELDTEYLEKNNFQTSIYGLKVRGSFETIEEARIRCQVLQRKDPRHNIFIGEVGVWCPWSPNPTDIADQEYANTELNTLMKKYNSSQDAKDLAFEERRVHKTNLVIEDNKTASSIVEEAKAEAEAKAVEAVVDEEKTEASTTVETAPFEEAKNEASPSIVEASTVEEGVSASEVFNAL
jgi:hypothetical protein